MISITLPDGSVRQYPQPLTVLEVAKDISEGLARNVLSAQFNQQTVEASTLIEKDVGCADHHACTMRGRRRRGRLGGLERYQARWASWHGVTRYT